MSKDTSARDELKHRISGIAIDIYKADQCISLIDRISSESARLNSQNYGDLFGSLQGYLREHMILSVTKIFEPPSNRFSTVSLPAAIELLENNAGELSIPEPVILQRDLEKLGVSAGVLHGLKEPDITKIVAQTLRDALPNPDKTAELNETLHALRTARNKKIAHNEAITVENLPRATWGEITPLLDSAKVSLGVIGGAYLSTAYTVDDGTYLLTSDAERASRALRRLFQNAGVADDSTANS